MEQPENRKHKPNSDEPAKHRLNFLAGWMNRLAAAYRQELSLETQAMYLDGLSDLRLDRLDAAFKRAVRECKFFPSIAEIRQLEAEIEIPQERLESAYERLKQRIAAQPVPNQLSSVLDDNRPKLREVRQLTEAEYKKRLEQLSGQKIKILDEEKAGA